MAVNGQESGGAGSWSTSDRGRKADGRLKENPWDVDAWGVLVREAQVMLYHKGASRIFHFGTGSGIFPP